MCFPYLKCHQNFPNQSAVGLESASYKINFFLSKPNWNCFGKSYAFFGCNFSKQNWIWLGIGRWIKCSCSWCTKCRMLMFAVEMVLFNFLSAHPHMLCDAWHVTCTFAQGHLLSSGVLRVRSRNLLIIAHVVVTVCTLPTWDSIRASSVSPCSEIWVLNKAIGHLFSREIFVFFFKSE